MPEKIVLGLIGRIGSGKTIVADYLVENYGASCLRFSDVLKDVLKRLHKPNTRENLQSLGIALRKNFSEGVLAEVLKEDVLASKNAIVVVDGIRYEDEFRMVKELGGRLIYVTALEKVRYERTMNRGTRGEAGLTFRQFIESEKKETEKLIDSLGKKADYKIENTGTVADLRKKVDGILRDMDCG